jgi:hypothetical protein
VNWSERSGKRMEEIKKMKVKDSKKECLRRKLQLATRLEEIGFKISTDPIPVVPILPRDNLETYVANRIAENDAHSLSCILKKISITKTNKRDHYDELFKVGI